MVAYIHKYNNTMAQDKRISTPRPLTTRSRVVRVIVAIIIILTAIPLAIHAATYLEHAKAQKDMTHYLQNKYGQEFVVEWPKRRASGLGVEGYLASIAYLAADRHLAFEVQTSSTGTWDNYIDRLWSNQASRDIKREIDSIMQGVPYVHRVTIGSQAVQKYLTAPLPNLSTVINEYGEQVVYVLEVESQEEQVSKNYLNATLLGKLLSTSKADVQLMYKWGEGQDRHLISIDKGDIKRLTEGSATIGQFDTMARR